LGGDKSVGEGEKKNTESPAEWSQKVEIFEGGSEGGASKKEKRRRCWDTEGGELNPRPCVEEGKNTTAGKEEGCLLGGKSDKKGNRGGKKTAPNFEQFGGGI